jgi:HD superfamily phosphodiesterase
MNEEKLKKIVKRYLLKCRPGDWSHSLRVVEWVKKLGKGRNDIDVLIISAYLHDIGWYKILPNNKKLSKKELKELEPQANKNTIPVVKKVLSEFGDSSIDTDTVIRFIDSAYKHKSSSEDEAIIVDADNLSKLNIDHVREKYQMDDWIKMYELWSETFANRIQTLKGKRIYPELLKKLKNEIDKRMNVQEINSSLKSLLWENDSEDILIIVGGSGDDRFTMSILTRALK